MGLWYGIRGVLVKALDFQTLPSSSLELPGQPWRRDKRKVLLPEFARRPSGPWLVARGSHHRALIGSCVPLFPMHVATLRFALPPSSSVWQDVAAASERTGRCSGANGAPTLLAREETRPGSRVGLLRWPTESGATARLSPPATLPHTALRAHWARPVHPDVTSLVAHVAGICAERAEL